MKITISDTTDLLENRIVSVETGNDFPDIHEVARELRGLLIAYGFHEDHVDEYLDLD